MFNIIVSFHRAVQFWMVLLAWFIFVYLARIAEFNDGNFLCNFGRLLLAKESYCSAWPRLRLSQSNH